LVFPLWNPYYYNGHPLFATLQPAVLYPFSLLYLFLPFDWAFNLNIEIHFILAGWFTYLLMRGLKASQAGSMIAGICFMLSGYMISVHNTLSTLLSVTWVPLFFLCFFSSIKNNKINHALLAGVVGTFMFLGGGIEACYLAFGTAFFLTLFPGLVLEVNDYVNLRYRLYYFTIFCAVFFGLSAVQLIPFLELSSLSIRDGGLTYAEAGTWSLHPQDLFEFFVPDLYGFASEFEKYWNYQNWLKSIYMGSFPFLLAIFFIKKFDRKALGFLLIIVVSVGLALGKNTSFHLYLYDYLPFFDKLRYPVKFIFLGVLALCIVAGLGYDQFKKNIVDEPEKTMREVKWVLIIGFMSMLFFGFLSFYNELVINFLKNIKWDSPDFNKAEINLFHFKRFLVFTSLFCLCLYLYSKPKFKNPYTLGFLFFLMTLDLFFAHYNHAEKTEWKRINQSSINAEFLLSDNSLYRVYTTPETKKLKVKSKLDWDIVRVIKEKLVTGIVGGQKFFQIRGEIVSKLKRGKNVNNLIASSPAIDSTNLLSLMNVKYVLSIPKIESPDYKLVHANSPIPNDVKKIKDFENSATLKIYENTSVLPRAFLVSNCRVMENDRGYKAAFLNKKFDPQTLVLLEKTPEGFDCEKNDTLTLKQEGSVKIESYKSNSVDLKVNSIEKQLLFMSDSFYPGWKAYIDGKEAEILRGNYLFRTIVIEKGEHEVRFEYDPLSFKMGLAISIATILICSLYVYRKRYFNERLEVNSKPLNHSLT
jgi:hypothetical protein